MMKTKRKTNVQFVRHLMEFSRHGALMQAFLIEAIDRYARECARADPKDFDAPLLSGSAWHGCAVEVIEGLDQHYGRPDPAPATGRTALERWQKLVDSDPTLRIDSST
jgi:hypothetical protein